MPLSFLSSSILPEIPSIRSMIRFHRFLSSIVWFLLVFYFVLLHFEFSFDNHCFFNRLYISFIVHMIEIRLASIFEISGLYCFYLRNSWWSYRFDLLPLNQTCKLQLLNCSKFLDSLQLRCFMILYFIYIHQSYLFFPMICQVIIHCFFLWTFFQNFTKIPPFFILFNWWILKF